MKSDWTMPPPAPRRRHLRLATAPAPEPEPAPDPGVKLTPQEVRAMAAVASHLRRRAGRLPEDSIVRAELLEAAEYYALGADLARAATARPRSRAS
jgi:hypothetical protein